MAAGGAWAGVGSAASAPDTPPARLLCTVIPALSRTLAAQAGGAKKHQCAAAAAPPHRLAALPRQQPLLYRAPRVLLHGPPHRRVLKPEAVPLPRDGVLYLRHRGRQAGSPRSQPAHPPRLAQL